MKKDRLYVQGMIKSLITWACLLTLTGHKRLIDITAERIPEALRAYMQQHNTGFPEKGDNYADK